MILACGGVSQDQVYLATFGPKSATFKKTHKSHARSPAVGQTDAVLGLGSKRPGCAYLALSTMCSVKLSTFT